jgi:flavin-dependent dehydrogenase
MPRGVAGRAHGSDLKKDGPMSTHTDAYPRGVDQHARSGRAVVIGGSIAGLLAARILADHFVEVLLIERDRFPYGPVPRKGVPQARHLHQVLIRGKLILEQLFPGLDAELLLHGALELDFVADTQWFNPLFGRGPHFDSGLLVTACSRDLLEWVIRGRVANYPAVSCMEAQEVVGLVASEDRTRVIGVRTRARGAAAAEQVQMADLVVDTSGRDSRAPEWLQELGYPAPQETVVNSFLGYASRYYERPSDLQTDWKLLWILPMPPTIPRAAVVFPTERGRWLVTLVGAARDYPPTDAAGFRAFARSLADPTVYNVISAATPLSPIYAYRRTESRLRHYERLATRPEGFVALGDAVCGFNPFYGQGMTAAANAALILDRCLREQRRRDSTGDLSGFAQRFHRQLARANTLLWLMATGADSLYPTTEGGHRTTLIRLMHWYLNQVLVVSSRNPTVYLRFLKVMHLRASPATLMHPGVVAAVVRNALQPALAALPAQESVIDAAEQEREVGGS